MSVSTESDLRELAARGAAELDGADAIDLGFSPHDDAIHAPNENIRLDYLEKGMLWMGQTI